MKKSIAVISALLLGGIAVVCLVANLKTPEVFNVKKHYANDSLRLSAANFLLENMEGKFSYEGEDLQKYDTIFNSFSSYFDKNGYSEIDPYPIRLLWDSVEKANGAFDYKKLDKKFDVDCISDSFLIKNIDAAFTAWQGIPNSVIAKDFRLFCEYVLPYRIGNEKIEMQRSRLLEEYKGKRDTVMANIKRTSKVLDKALRRNGGFKNSNLMWRYPISLSVSQLEKTHRGSCLHLCEYYVHLLRAMGIPSTIDFVEAWGNRGGAHCWVSVLTDSATHIPMDALSGKAFRITYKPAKIFRKTFKRQPIDKNASKYIPSQLLDPYRVDVSDRYFKTHTLRVKGFQNMLKQHSDIPYAVICVFDNTEWIPVDYGRIENGNFVFRNMIGDVCYMVAYCIDGRNVPITNPFILSSDGKIKMLRSDSTKRTLNLKRKYPRFRRMVSFARKLQKSQVEASNDVSFRDSTVLFVVEKIPGDVNVSVINSDKKYRYVRWKMQDDHTGNVAEISFWGKRSAESQEQKLTGKIIGSPIPSEHTQHPYWHAVDGDYSTFFDKRVGEHSFVGIDLGRGNESFITKIVFHPQSDTNYIIPGDTYELWYWNRDHWNFFGKQKAHGHNLIFKNVPGTLFILHNISQGVEERIFTYEDGKQIWW